MFNGVDVFRTEAKLLVKHITESGNYDETDWELRFTYHFPSLGIGLWRSMIFEYDMIYTNDFKDMPAEIQIDQMKYLFFESVCVYAADYYNK